MAGQNKAAKRRSRHDGKCDVNGSGKKKHSNEEGSSNEFSSSIGRREDNRKHKLKRNHQMEGGNEAIPRWKQKRNKKKKRTENKARSHASGTHQISSITGNIEQDDIVEQLRRQRLKQETNQHIKAEEADRSHLKKADRKSALGNFVYDPASDAYFPADSLSHKKKRKKDDDTEPSSDFHSSQTRFRAFPHSIVTDPHLSSTNTSLSRTIRPALLSYGIQACVSPVQRRYLLGNFSGRCLLESMKITPYDKTATTYFVNPVSSVVPVTTTQWARTFDIGSTISYDGNRYNTESFRQIPCLVRTFSNNPLYQRYAFRNEPYGRELFCHGHCVRMFGLHNRRYNHDNNEQYLQESIGFLTASNNSTFFTLLDQDGNSNSIVDVAGEVNDVCYMRQKQTYIFGRCRTGRRGILVKFSLNEQSLEDANINSHFPRSDILCMESRKDISSDDDVLSDEVVLSGHRNGQISLVDFRTTECISTFQATSMGTNHDANSLFGSIVRMNVLSSMRPNQILARGSGGDARLYDIRGMTTSTGLRRNNNQRSSDPAVIYDLKIPSCERVQSASGLSTMRCKGIATDPLQSMAIYPFVDAKSGDHKIGTWCLFSGHFIGSKKVSASWITRRETAPCDEQTCLTDSLVVPELELASKITPAWELLSDRDSGAQRGLIKSPGRFGLWLNWTSRGVYQLKFNGHHE